MVLLLGCHLLSSCCLELISLLYALVLESFKTPWHGPAVYRSFVSGTGGHGPAQVGSAGLSPARLLQRQLSCASRALGLLACGDMMPSQGQGLRWALLCCSSPTCHLQALSRFLQHGLCVCFLFLVLWVEPAIFTEPLKKDFSVMFCYIILVCQGHVFTLNLL